MATRTYRDGTVFLAIPKATALELYTRANVYLLYGECYALAEYADAILCHNGDVGLEVGLVKDIVKQYENIKNNDTRTIFQPRGENARGADTLRQTSLCGTARRETPHGKNNRQRDCARKGNPIRKAKPKTLEGQQP